MQILDYENKENTHVCLNCDTEFAVRITSTEDDQLAVAFCPCCGETLDDEEDGFDGGDEGDEWE
jgi:transcription elongation factor Elf1